MGSLTVYKITIDLEGQYNFVNSMGFHIVYALTECTSTMVYIWPDDGSMSRNV